MKKVSRHKFNSNYTASEVADDLEFLRTTLADRLQAAPSGCGKHVDANLIAACWAHSIGLSKEALELFHGACEVAGAMFAAVAAEPDTTIAFVFRGTTLTGPSGPPKYGALPPYWVNVLLLTMALRRGDISETMLAVPPATFQKAPGEVDACFLHLVHALRSFFADEDFTHHVDEFERLSRPEALKVGTPRVVERFRALGPILIALRNNDEEHLRKALVAHLEVHKKRFSSGKEAKDPEGLIDVHAAGLMRVALDRGLKLDVESDYVPKWLIGLEQP